MRPGKEIEGLRGGVHRYAAQENPKIDTARVEKGTFRMETSTTPTFLVAFSKPMYYIMEA